MAKILQLFSENGDGLIARYVVGREAVEGVKVWRR